MSEIINAFPGYEYIDYNVIDNDHHNMYRGIDLKFGGYVYSEPGIYTDVALLDIQSMHPSSAVAMNYFGEYTKRFKDLLDARIAIKNGDNEKLKTMFDGALMKYVQDDSLRDQLATAIKLVINSVYGLSSAKFDNAFRDKRNVNNIVALRGALFMKTLQDEIVARGFTVAGIRTDSIKIPNATNDIISFCMEFAKKYGYSFQHEATYDRMCLVDKANYIAAYKDPAECEKMYGYIPKDNAKHFKKYDHPWTATGDAFQRPYIFKSLFSGEPIVFDDYCETKSTSKGEIYFDFNEGLPNTELLEKEQAKRKANATSKSEKKVKLNPLFANLSDDDISAEIAKGHNYHFVGRVGRFYPIAPGKGGGELLVYRNGKYDSVSGAKDYRWMEAEVVKAAGREADIDPKYHRDQLDEAIAAINEFGDFDRFVDTSQPYICDKQPIPTPGLPFKEEDDERAPWEDLPSVVPCGDCKYNTCMECPCCEDDICTRGYSLAVENGA